MSSETSTATLRDLAPLEDLVCVLDASAIVTAANPAWERVLGWPPGRLIGSSLLDVLHPADVACPLTRVAAAEARGSFEARLLHVDGTHRTFLWSTFDDGGTTTAVGKDVTAQFSERDRLRAALQRVWESHTHARLSSWEWDPVTDSVDMWTQLSAEAGLHTDHRPPASEVLRLTPEPYRSDVTGALRAVARNGGTRSLRFPVVPAGGGELWMQTWMRRIKVDGRVLVRGTMQDVTALHEAERATQASRGFWQATLDSLSAHIAVLDAQGRIIAVNDAWLQFGADNGGKDVGIGANYLEICDVAAESDPVSATVAAGLRQILGGERERLELEYPCHAPTEERWFSVRASRYLGPGAMRVVVHHENVTDRRRNETEIRLQAGLIDALDTAVLAFDLDQRVIHANSAAEQLLGPGAGGLHGKTFAELMPDRPRLQDYFATVLARGTFEHETDIKRHDGATLRIYSRASTVSNADGETIGVVLGAIDVTARAEVERQLRGARDFLRAVAQEMAEGLFTVDSGLRFSHVNAAAERMLGRSQADLLGTNAHEVLHEHCDDPDCALRAALVANETVRVEQDAFGCAGADELPVGYSAAPFLSESGGAGRIVVFSDISERMSRERELTQQLAELEWVERIRRALAEDRFVLYAQPIIEIATGRTVQRELLIRMIDEQGRVVAPGEFLPIAEEHGLIRDIDRWVLDRALAMAADGHPVEMNLSASSMVDPTLFDDLQSALARHGADPQNVVLEITETALISDLDAASTFITRVQALGFGVALDDFGTGYGGFTYLKRLPVGTLKIDREFVRDLHLDHASKHVVNAVVSLARGFGIKTVAEGVEDPELLAMLADLGVDYAQGFGLGRPAPL